MKKMWIIATSIGAILAITGCSKINAEQDINKNNIQSVSQDINNNKDVNTTTLTLNDNKVEDISNIEYRAPSFKEVSFKGDYDIIIDNTQDLIVTQSDMIKNSKYKDKIITLNTIYVYGNKNQT